MAFSQLKSDLSGRIRPKFVNFAVVLDRLDHDGSREMLIGKRIPDGQVVKVALSRNRAWRERQDLHTQFASVEPGCAVILYESELIGDVHEIRYAGTVNTQKDEPAKIVHNYFARVGEPVQYENGWAQPVQVLHAQNATVCATKEDATTAIIAAFERGDVGGQGFVLRGIDEDGVAIAVRFQRVWSAEQNGYLSAIDSYNAFLDAEVIVQGLSEHAAGWQVLDWIGSAAGASWEIIPITSLNMRGKQVQAAAEGAGRNRAAPYRYDLAAPRAGSGFVPSLVVLAKANGFYCREALPVTGGVPPIALPYVPTPNFQPKYEPEVKPRGPEYLKPADQRTPGQAEDVPANDVSKSEAAEPSKVAADRPRRKPRESKAATPQGETANAEAPAAPAPMVDAAGEPMASNPIETAVIGLDEEISIDDASSELDGVDLSGLASLDNDFPSPVM